MTFNLDCIRQRLLVHVPDGLCNAIEWAISPNSHHVSFGHSASKNFQFLLHSSHTVPCNQLIFIRKAVERWLLSWFTLGSRALFLPVTSASTGVLAEKIITSCVSNLQGHAPFAEPIKNWFPMASSGRDIFSIRVECYVPMIWQQFFLACTCHI